MKRAIFTVIAVMLAMAMVAVVFSGCKIKEVPSDIINQTEEPTLESEVTDEAPISGGWTYASEFTDVQMPEDATEAFTAATKDIEGAIYKPVVYLGSQVVAGLNYVYICEITTVTENPVSTLNIIKIYRDLEGNATVTGTKALNISEYNGDPGVETPVLAGGWSFDEASGGKLPDDVKEAYSAAKEELEGSEYEPLACLGSQVVAGTNYAVLCKDVTEEGSTSLAVIIVYNGIGGENQIVSIGAFSIPEFN